MAASWKRALGLVKDRTSIGLAKFASTRVPDLDVAIVKATSHDDAAVDEKYVQEILHLTAISLGYANACLQGLTKRISKTHDWIVAIKVLVLTHRLLREGNPAFEDDLKTVSRRSLNAINFRDESHSNAWDFSAFVRNYASYLDARLDCFLFTSTPRGVRSGQDDRNSAYSDARYSVSSNRSSFSTYPFGDNQSMQSVYRKQKIPVKEMEPDMLIEMLPHLQQVLERVLTCHPTGIAKNHRLVQISLYMIVKESFQIYSEICEGIGSLLNVYYDMKLEDCSRTFDIYIRFARQSESLASFYNSTKSMGICRPSEYPPVERVSQDYLDSLENFLRDRSRSARFQPPNRSNTKGRPLSPLSDKEIDPVSFERMYGVRALPAPPTEAPQTIVRVEKQPDLIDLGDNEPSTGTGDDRMALALFSDSSKATISNNWATFDTAPAQAASQKSAITNTQSQPSLDATNKSGLSGWELALVSEASSLANVKAAPTVGNIDRFQFETMYNQAASKPNTPLVALPGSASSVAMFARPTTPFLALPAPGSFAGQDPFAASAAVAPPHYVQLADLSEKQRYLLQEQQHWQQSQMNGAYGHYGLMQFYQPPYAGAVMAPQTSFGVPYYGMAGYGQSR